MKTITMKTFLYTQNISYENHNYEEKYLKKCSPYFHGDTEST